MDYIIVGAGISGLYCAYALHKNFGISNITIIEKNERLGGRIMTKYLSNDLFIEMGAGGIINVQTNVNKLVKELGIEVKYQKYKNTKAYVELVVQPLLQKIPEAPELTNIYLTNKLIHQADSDFYQIINLFSDKLSDSSFYQMALNYNLHFLIEKYYGVDKADQLMYQHGYHNDFINYNAIDAIAMFQYSNASDALYSRINGGMSQIIQKLEDYLTKNSITIKTETECQDIVKENSIYRCILKDGTNISATNIVFAIPKLNMMQIKYLDTIKNKLESVSSKSLIRIYLFFPAVNDKVWFDDLL